MAIGCLCLGMLLFAGARQALAYCVYNHTKYTIHVKGKDCWSC